MPFMSYSSYTETMVVIRRCYRFAHNLRPVGLIYLKLGIQKEQ